MIISIGITAVIMNISLGVRIRGPAPRSHLPPEEQHHPDQEGDADNQWRGQRRKILEHPLSPFPACPAHPLLALCLTAAGGCAQPCLPALGPGWNTGRLPVPSQ